MATARTHYNIQDSYLYPIVRLERVLSHKWRRRFNGVMLALLGLMTMIIVSLYVLTSTDQLPAGIESLVSAALPRVVGAIFLMSASFLIVYMLEAFYRSHYYKEKELSPDRILRADEEDLLSFQTLRILSRMRRNDLTDAFLTSVQGERIIMRLGIPSHALSLFIRERRSKESPMLGNPPVDSTKIFTLTDLASYIFNNDPVFSDFLFEHGALERHLLGATRWIVRANEEEKEQERWWTKRALEKYPGLGTDWSYGEAYVLNRYAHELLASEGAKAYSFTSLRNQDQLDQVVDILSKSRESNALLVGEQGGGKMSLLYAFAKRTSEGSVPKNIERKRVMLLNTDLVISSVTDKTSFEERLIKVLNDAVRSGNIILAFDNFASFLISARTLGSDVSSLLDPYLDSDDIQIMALADKEPYHQYIETDPDLMRRFEVILVEQPNEDESVVVLQRVAERLERQFGVVFTYRAIEEAVNGVRNYFVDPIMPDKGIDLLVELPERAKRDGLLVIDRHLVMKLIEEKTNVPVGDIGTDERDRLMKLETLLHERVIGQDEAVAVVSNAMRRSRSGVRSMARPIGSFLFIGPTGVGKTETAKALASVYFGDEEAMARIDMSEFNGADSMDRLIGSFDSGRVGILTKILHERPYGVILLDELEKATKDVHDLFLQILDEGFFTDARGKRVNARNSIFIATSNAGSQLIFEMLQKNSPLEEARRIVIDHIVQQGVFKPEFVNRFDAVVLFHPLTIEYIEKIAAIMLDNLSKRLSKKGFSLSITSDLVHFVAEQGVDPVFGARPMHRYIQDHIEQIVADKVISGELREGGHITLSPADLKIATPQQAVPQPTPPPTPPPGERMSP